MKVIGIVGLPGSGKGECSRVAEELGIPIINMGDVIRSEVRKAGLPPLDIHMGAIAKQLRETHGMGAVAKACIPVIEKMHTPVVLIDGIRGEAEVRIFADHFPGFSLLAIQADRSTRLSRLRNRKRADDCQTISELEERDLRETSFGLIHALNIADITIHNTGTIEVFHGKIRDILGELVFNNEI